MNDAVIQHHFEEVFNALQEKDNFEIFTKIKAVTKPRVRKIITNIIESPSLLQDESLSEDESRFGKSEDLTLSSSYRPKSFKSEAVASRDNKVEMRNTLFECRFCGRYILGDFLEVHEEKCGSDTV
ncbi:unnamed protein product [Phaedon cochleariae]|uniref:Uncharacterized protein n=1 Tax=Phaedon cochleariae TaxID=80249 RepID=A0A9P0DSJ4_PHACE|nr:unnamed protein product [Phaedon cochleariae]